MSKAMILWFMYGVGAGVLVTLILVFGTGWAVTSSSAQATAEEMAKGAVVDRLAPICVAQFRQDPDAAKKLKKLKDSPFWDRADLLEEWGFVTMPGEKTLDIKVARKCAEKLLTQLSP